jgi:hypothetical protein
VVRSMLESFRASASWVVMSRSRAYDAGAEGGPVQCSSSWAGCTLPVAASLASLSSAARSSVRSGSSCRSR